MLREAIPYYFKGFTSHLAARMLAGNISRRVFYIQHAVGPIGKQSERIFEFGLQFFVLGL
jgi:hypothetical protein